jgi:hypothetical protein
MPANIALKSAIRGINLDVHSAGISIATWLVGMLSSGPSNESDAVMAHEVALHLMKADVNSHYEIPAG